MNFKEVPKTITNWDHETVHLGLIRHSENHSPISQASLWNHKAVYIKIIGEYNQIFIVT